MEETHNHNSCGPKGKPKQSKSFHEGNTTRLEHDEELTLVIKQKFQKSKEYVNQDLVKFTGDLTDVLEDAKDSNPESRASVETILHIAIKCKNMSTDEFWFKCESIVQELDDKRKELQIGALRRAYTSLLFILTRCTRLVQVLKEDQSLNQEFWFLNAENFRGM